jgi:dTDP-4-dehydrorhamnose reductase
MRILVTGASGQLGGYLLRELKRRGLAAHAWSGSRTGEFFDFPLRPIDLTDADAVADAFAAAAPEIVLHCAALTKVADCHRDPDLAGRTNTGATARLTELCRRAGARLVYVSTDLVFDGKRGNYHEGDEPSPLSGYGRSQWQAEEAVLAAPNSVVARVSLLFGPSVTGRTSFFDEQIAGFCARRPVNLFVDEWRTPLDLPTAAAALAALGLSDQTGLYHVGGRERLSRWEMGRQAATFLGIGTGAIVAAKQGDFGAPEPRPRDVSLDSSKWRAAFPQQPWPRFLEALQGMNEAGLFAHISGNPA